MMKKILKATFTESELVEKLHTSFRLDIDGTDSGTDSALWDKTRSFWDVKISLSHERGSERSERANEWAVQANERMSKRTSEWPSTYVYSYLFQTTEHWQRQRRWHPFLRDMKWWHSPRLSWSSMTRHRDKRPPCSMPSAPDHFSYWFAVSGGVEQKKFESFVGSWVASIKCTWLMYCEYMRDIFK